MMESQYQQIPARPDQEAAYGCRQLKGFCDNRPSFAVQRKMIEGMNRSVGVMQRVCVVPGLTQNGCNCGLFCIRMAVEALGGSFSEADYDKAAEDSGSVVGEIFGFDMMKRIVEALPGRQYKAERIGFTDEATLKAAIGRSGTNPTLIAFSNLSYKTARGVPDSLLNSKVHTQRGHWSVIQAYDDKTGQLTMMNPNDGSAIQTIQLGDMLAANQKMEGTTVVPTSPTAVPTVAPTPQFDWSTFTGKSYDSMETAGKYTLSKVTPGGKFTRTIAGGAVSGLLDVKQDIVLAGYIVVISKS